MLKESQFFRGEDASLLLRQVKLSCNHEDVSVKVSDEEERETVLHF